jgi:predicted nucleic acid-binding protein
MSEDKKLGRHAKSIFDTAEDGDAIIVVPAIVLAEISHILEKDKFKDLIERIGSARNYTVLPLEIRVIKRMIEFERIHELHDKIITASASILNASLLTKDEKITKSGYIKTIW